MIKDAVWRYYAKVVRVIDGDTVELDLDLGFKLSIRGSFRLLGLNAREKSEPGGPQAAEHLAKMLPVGTELLAGSVKLDKYGGRYDAVLFTGDGGVNLNDRLIATGWAAAWNGSGERVLPPWPRETRTN